MRDLSQDRKGVTSRDFVHLFLKRQSQGEKTEDDDDVKKKQKEEPRTNVDLLPPYDDMDEKSQFHYLNSQLPPRKRFKMPPMSSAKMTYLDIAEEGPALGIAHEHF